MACAYVYLLLLLIFRYVVYLFLYVQRGEELAHITVVDFLQKKKKKCNAKCKDKTFLIHIIISVITYFVL